MRQNSVEVDNAAWKYVKLLTVLLSSSEVSGSHDMEATEKTINFWILIVI